MSERKFAKGKYVPESAEQQELSAISTVARMQWWQAKKNAHDAVRRGLPLRTPLTLMRDAFVAKQYVSRKLTERWQRLLGGAA